MPKVSKSILEAAAEGNEILLRKIIKSRRKINLRDNHNWTALHHAVMSKSVPCVKLLLEETKLSPQAESFEGCTPLLLACMYRETPVEIVEELLKRDKTLVEYMNNEMESPLHIAVSNNRLDIVKLLVENGADVNYTDLDEDTPLHIAASKLNYDIIEYLLYTSPCDVWLQNGFNLNPFELVVHLYEITLMHLEQADNIPLVLKCLDLISDFTYDEILYPGNELFELKLGTFNEVSINFIINKYFLNNSSQANSCSQYFTNLMLNYKLFVYPAYLLVHDSVESINDLSRFPTGNDYTAIFNHFFMDFKDDFYEIIYEILSRGDNCFEMISSRNDFIINDIYSTLFISERWPDIIQLLSQFNYDLNLLRYNIVTTLQDYYRFDSKLNCIRVLNSFTTFDHNFIDFDFEPIAHSFATINDIDTFMELLLPVYEHQWMRLIKLLYINYVPSLKYMAVFTIRKTIFANYPNNSNCLKLRMIDELPIPQLLKRCLIYDYKVM